MSEPLQLSGKRRQYDCPRCGRYAVDAPVETPRELVDELMAGHACGGAA